MKLATLTTLLAASATFAPAYADPIDFTTPLVFTGGTEITESNDDHWNADSGLSVEINGENNFLYGNNGQSFAWKDGFGTLTGSGYLTMQRDAQWSIGFSGRTADFTGTLHIKHVGYNQTYFGIGENALSFENGSIVLEAGSDNAIYFSNYAPTRKIGDLSTTGDNPQRMTVRKKNDGTLYIGYLNKDSTFGGVFANEGTTQFDIVKVGSGVWTLNGEVAITIGTFSVNQGQVNFNCPVSSAVTVAAGATLGGTGTLSGTVSASAGAVLAFTEDDALTFTGAADLSGFPPMDLTIQRNI